MIRQALQVWNLWFDDTADNIAATAKGKLVATFTYAQNVAITGIVLSSSILNRIANPLSLMGVFLAYGTNEDFVSPTVGINILASHWTQGNASATLGDTPSALTTPLYYNADGLILQANRPIGLYALAESDANSRVTVHATLYGYLTK